MLFRMNRHRRRGSQPSCMRKSGRRWKRTPHHTRLKPFKQCNYNRKRSNPMLGVLIGEWVCLARRAQHGFELLFRIPLTGFSPFYFSLRFAVSKVWGGTRQSVTHREKRCLFRFLIGRHAMGGGLERQNGCSGAAHFRRSLSCDLL